MSLSIGKGYMALTYPAKLGIAIDLLISACPSPVFSRLSKTPSSNLGLTRVSLDVCALTAAKGVCSGSIESIFSSQFSSATSFRLPEDIERMQDGFK
jgi:hypothetical protein